MATPETKDCHTISMASSNLNWNDIDKKIRESPFKNRSQYIQYLVEKDFKSEGFLRRKFDTILVLISICLIMILILVSVIAK